MTVVKGVGAGAAVAGGRPARAAAGSFRLPAGAAGTMGSMAGVAAAAEVGLPGMLALQEVQAEPVADREARRHGQAMLAELAALQRSLLGAGADDLARLERLAAGGPEAEDPSLRAAVAAIRLRARIELARREARA